MAVCGPAGGIRPRCDRRCGAGRSASPVSRCSSSSIIRSPVELPANTLMGADAAGGFELRQVAGCLRRGAADIEAHVAPGDCCSTYSCFQAIRVRVGDGRAGVRHVEHGGRGRRAPRRGCRWGCFRRWRRRGRADAHAGRSGRAARAGPVASMVCVGGGVGRGTPRAAMRPSVGRRRWSAPCPRAARRCRRGSAGRNAGAWPWSSGCRQGAYHEAGCRMKQAGDAGAAADYR